MDVLIEQFIALHALHVVNGEVRVGFLLFYAGLHVFELTLKLFMCEALVVESRCRYLNLACLVSQDFTRFTQVPSSLR